jgi:hypothetical protein
MPIDPLSELQTLPRIERDNLAQNERETMPEYMDRLSGEIADYLDVLALELERGMLGELVSIMNLLLSIVNVGVWYSNLPDSNGVYPNGTWRIRDDGTDFLIEVKISGTWRAKWKFEQS